MQPSHKIRLGALSCAGTWHAQADILRAGSLAEGEARPWGPSAWPHHLCTWVWWDLRSWVWRNLPEGAQSRGVCRGVGGGGMALAKEALLRWSLGGEAGACAGAWSWGEAGSSPEEACRGAACCLNCSSACTHKRLVHLNLLVRDLTHQGMQHSQTSQLQSSDAQSLPCLIFAIQALHCEGQVPPTTLGFCLWVDACVIHQIARSSHGGEQERGMHEEADMAATNRQGARYGMFWSELHNNKYRMQIGP